MDGVLFLVGSFFVALIFCSGVWIDGIDVLPPTLGTMILDSSAE